MDFPFSKQGQQKWPFDHPIYSHLCRKTAISTVPTNTFCLTHLKPCSSFNFYTSCYIFAITTINYVFADGSLALKDGSHRTGSFADFRGHIDQELNSRAASDLEIFAKWILYKLALYLPVKFLEDTFTTLYSSTGHVS